MNGFYRVLRLALNDGLRWGYVNKNLAQKANAPISDSEEIIVMTPPEQAQLVELVKAETDPESNFCHRNGALTASINSTPVHLALLTGMRRGEIAALRFSDIDLKGKTITVRRALAESDGKIIEKRPKTLNGKRKIEIDAGLVAKLPGHLNVMNEYRANLGPKLNTKGWLFVQQNGSALAPRALNRRLAGLLKRAGLHGRGHGFHVCRHTHIPQLLMQNVPLIMVSRRSGHASVATTMNMNGHLISQMANGVVESHLQEIQQDWV